MGDCADVYKGIREEKKRWKKENLGKFDSTNWTEITPHYFTRTYNKTFIEYWPSTRKCRFNRRGKVYFGDPIKILDRNK